MAANAATIAQLEHEAQILNEQYETELANQKSFLESQLQIKSEELNAGRLEREQLKDALKTAQESVTLMQQQQSDSNSQVSTTVVTAIECGCRCQFCNKISQKLTTKFGSWRAKCLKWKLM